MVQPTTWLLLALALLVARTAAAQPQLPLRQRQDRHALLPATPGEPLLELYMAAGYLTTLAFNGGRLDRDSVVVDRTRFKWVDAGDNILALQLIADLGPGERLIVKISFKDKALPAQAILSIVTHPTLVDGNVEVDRQTNTSEALMAALVQKTADLEELKARCEGANPAGLVLSGWLDRYMSLAVLTSAVASGDTSGLEVMEAIGYESESSALVAVRLRNLPGQKPWAVGRARITRAGGTPVPVLSARMKLPHLAPGGEGLVVVEVKAAPWDTGQVFNLELVDATGQRRLSLNLSLNLKPEFGGSRR